MNKYETEVIEYKLKLNDSFEKELVAFLNTNGGKVLIGINNNGEVCGVENLDQTMKNISDIIVNGILPNPQEYVKVSAKYIEGKMIVEVDIQKGKELYYIRKYGRSARGCYIRIGTSCRSMNDEEIKSRFIESINYKDKEIIDIKTYNQNLTFEILKTSLITKGFHVNEDNFVNNYKLINENGEFNLLANLLADSNDIYIQVVCFEGDNKEELIGKTEYGYKSIISITNRLMDRLEAINITKSIIGIPYRIDKRLLDMKCLREAVINAIAHNNWIEGVPPIIYVFKNRIEIVSTGGLPKNLSKEEFYLGISKPRNKELMRIFSDLDLVERSGYGVPKIINIYGKEVFEITDNFIRVILPFDKEVMRLIESEKVADKTEKVADKSEKVADKSEKVADKSEKVADKSEKVADKTQKVADKTEKVADKTQKVADKTEKVADKTQKVADKLNKTQVLILEKIKKDPYIRIKDLMLQLLLSDFGVRKCLKYLKDNNIIYRVGSNKNGYWIVNDDALNN